MPLSLGPDPSTHAAGLIQALADAVDHVETSPRPNRPSPPPLYVAYSGGMDSTVLLACAWYLWPHRVRALHVDHGLHPQSAAWAESCRARCADTGIPVSILPVDLAGVTSNIESQARSARYQAFDEAMAEAGVLLMAHHQDDQQETLLLRLMRGSGLDGLSGMPAQRRLGAARWLVRPWLDFPRAALAAVAQAANLSWTDDPSNADTRFDRNFLRQQVVPLLRERWPALNQTLSRSQGLLQQASQRLQDCEQQGLRSATDNGTTSLSVSALVPDRAVSGQAQSLVRRWLQAQGITVRSAAQLEHIVHDVALAAPDARGEVQLGAYRVRRYQGQLYLLPPMPPPPPHPVLWTDPDEPLQHPAWGQVALAAAPAGSPGGVLDADRLRSAVLRVACRQGGEYCQPAGRAGGRDLKRLLQEARVPPWHRDRLPLLYADDVLVAAAGVFVSDGWQAASGTQGWQLVWHLGDGKVD